MTSLTPRNIVKRDSLEEFEFLDAEDDLNVDLSKSPAIDAAEKFGSGLSQILSALITITEEEGLIVSAPVKALAATAVGAVTGSLLGGPPGLAIGLLTGAVMAIAVSPKASKSSKTNKKSTIREVFSQMTLQQKKELLKELLGCLKQPNMRVLVYEIVKNEKIRNTAISIVSNFLLKKMGLCLAKSI